MARKTFNVGEIMRSLEKEILEINERTAERIVGTIVLATPIGNPALWRNPPPANYHPGNARANWRATIGGAPAGATQNVDPSGASTIANARSTIRIWNGLKDKLVISNNAAHIVPLDEGTASKQVGANFVEKAVSDGIAFSAGERKELP